MIIRRFIGIELLRGWITVIVVLASLFGLLALLDESESLSERYTFVDALRYVAYTTPQRVTLAKSLMDGQVLADTDVIAELLKLFLPGQTPDFDEYTLVLDGSLHVESAAGTLEKPLQELIAQTGVARR